MLPDNDIIYHCNLGIKLVRIPKAQNYSVKNYNKETCNIYTKPRALYYLVTHGDYNSETCSVFLLYSPELPTPYGVNLNILTSE